MRPKITVVGAGNVGAQTAFYAALRNLGDIVLVDVVEGLPQGKALDILESMPLVGNDINVIGSNSYEETKNSDIAVVTAGIARKPGMSRDDLIQINANIMKSIIPEIVKFSPNCILIIVSNPLDAMVTLAHKLSGFPRNRVIGMAGVLDSTRFRTFIAKELNVSVKDVNAMVLGGHGDSMVPIINNCTVRGKPITECMPKEKVEAIVERTKNGGGEIVTLLKTGSAFFAPGVSIVEMVEAILHDSKKVLPCAALLEGEYGVHGLFIGVPVRLGRKGVEEVVELNLSEQEKEAFLKSVEHVKSLVEKV
ncbi:MAG TPA: malate dehydrogenase [Candidatus Nanoarchaeia archaeon]|nr:malate dehydrogenase [Candidatus Nanoarchaeia archaeon]